MVTFFAFHEVITWIILLILSFFSQLLFYLVLLHFKSLLRSLDIGLIGLMTRNMFNCVVAVPIIITISYSDFSWSKASCSMVIFVLHSSYVVSIILNAFFAVDRLFLLRKDGGPVYNGWFTNKVKPILLCSVWGCSFLIIGLLPVNLWVKINLPVGTNSCLFLPSHLDYSYSLVLLSCSLASALISGICSWDGWIHLRNMSTVKSETSNSNDDVLHTSAEYLYDIRKHSWESWRLTTVVNTIVFLLNHFPMMIVDFYALTVSPLFTYSGSPYIWLILIESILLPNSLWICSVRYRHVLQRYWTKVTKRTNGGEDKYCAMQMFQKRCTLMGSVYRGHKDRSRSLADQSSLNGASQSATLPMRAVSNAAFNSFEDDFNPQRQSYRLSTMKYNIHHTHSGSNEEDRSTTSNNNELMYHDKHTTLNNSKPISSGEIVSATIRRSDHVDCKTQEDIHVCHSENSEKEQMEMFSDQCDDKNRIDSVILHTQKDLNKTDFQHNETLDCRKKPVDYDASNNFYLTEEECLSISKGKKATSDNDNQQNGLEIIPIAVADWRKRRNSLDYHPEENIVFSDELSEHGQSLKSDSRITTPISSDMKNTFSNEVNEYL